MKISGPNKPNINPYQEQIKKQVDHKKDVNRKDQLEISSKAKQLQKSEQPNVKRASYVENIKNEIKSGTYKVNYEETAQKMIDYWSKQ